MKKIKEGSILKATLIGVLISIAATILLTMLVSIFINNEYIDITSITTLAYICIFLSVLFGAITGGSVVAERKWCVYSSVGGVYYLLALCVGMLCFDGIGKAFLPGLLMCVLSVLTAVFLAKSKKKRSVKGRRKMRTR